MAKPTPTSLFVVRPHDPARRRREWMLVAVAWIGSSLLVAALTSGLMSGAARDNSAVVLVAAEHQNETLKARVAILERSEQVAKAAVTDVQQTLRERDEEIGALRADLAFYGRLVGGGKHEGLAVHAFAIKPVKDARAWNFNATMTQNFKRGQDVKGHLTVSVEGIQDGKLATLDWNALDQGENAAGIEYGFKYFQQVSGTIMLPPGFTANRVVVHADGDGGRVDQAFSWSDALKGEESDDVRQ